VKALSRYRVMDVALGPTHSAVLVEPGHVYTFGSNSLGELGSGNTKPRDAPAPVKQLEDKTVTVCFLYSVQSARANTNKMMIAPANFIECSGKYQKTKWYAIIILMYSKAVYVFFLCHN